MFAAFTTRSTLVLGACLLAVSVGARSSLRDVRGLSIDRPLQGAATLPEGAVGGHPLDALTPGWPWCHLVVEADLADEAQADVVEDLLGRVKKFGPRVRVIVVDLGERDAGELDFLLWEAGWHHAPVAFATELDPLLARSKPGWHFHRPEPPLGDVGVAVPKIPVVDGELDSAVAIAKSVVAAAEERIPGYRHLFSGDYLELALELEIERLERPFRRMEAEAGPEGITSGEPLTLKLVVETLRDAVPHLLAEAELALRMGQPVDAARRVEAIEAVFGEDEAVAAELARLTALGLDKDAIKADEQLRKVLGDELPRNRRRLGEKLDAFVADGEAPAAVLERAARYRGLLERFPL